MAETRRRSEPAYRLRVEKDVEIPARDGARLMADIFRPDSEERFPAVLNIGPYQKDKLWIPPPDLEEAPNEYMNWETANPLWWVPRGYILIRIDTRGTGKSLGHCDPGGLIEALDYYDAIEWAAKQDWCSGKVGTLGISYYASVQWRVANLQPPSLKAIIPWEGWGDCYRDRCFHGGIFSLDFCSNWQSKYMAHHLLGKTFKYNTDSFRTEGLWECMRHSLDSNWWRERSAQWDKIDVPLFSVGNWGGHGLHLRGNVDGYVESASRHKKLRIHTGTHFHPFHSEEGRVEQLRFLDFWLKGIDTGIMDEPPINLQIRTGGGGPYTWRYENEWPLARTVWTKFYLHGQELSPAGKPRADGSLARAPASEQGALHYDATIMGRSGIPAASWAVQLSGDGARFGVAFETDPLQEDMEVTGPVKLVLWVSSTTEDMDIFATVRNIGPDSQDVFEIGPQGQKMPVAKGWLRASQRKLDPKRSTFYRPYHTHDERCELVPDEPVCCEIEIWPTCIVFKAGHRIRLDIQPRDGICSAPYTHHHADYNMGRNAVHFGGPMPSHLLLPVIPARSPL